VKGRNIVRGFRNGKQVMILGHNSAVPIADWTCVDDGREPCCWRGSFFAIFFPYGTTLLFPDDSLRNNERLPSQTTIATILNFCQVYIKVKMQVYRGNPLARQILLKDKKGCPFDSRLEKTCEPCRSEAGDVWQTSPA
jgi:hypothetical protein